MLIIEHKFIMLWLNNKYNNIHIYEYQNMLFIGHRLACSLSIKGLKLGSQNEHIHVIFIGVI